MQGDIGNENRFSINITTFRFKSKTTFVCETDHAQTDSAQTEPFQKCYAHPTDALSYNRSHWPTRGRPWEKRWCCFDARIKEQIIKYVSAPRKNHTRLHCRTTERGCYKSRLKDLQVSDAQCCRQHVGCTQ